MILQIVGRKSTKVPQTSTPKEGSRVLHNWRVRCFEPETIGLGRLASEASYMQIRLTSPAAPSPGRKRTDYTQASIPFHEIKHGWPYRAVSCPCCGS